MILVLPLPEQMAPVAGQNGFKAFGKLKRGKDAAPKAG